MAKKKIVSRSTRVDASKAGRKAEKGTQEVYQGSFEAEWSCTSCGREHIPGREKICPACSNPRQTGEDYQKPETRKEYLTGKELDEMGVDPDQHLSDETCQYCQAKIKPGTQICPNCSANLVDTGYTHRHCPACERETNELICPNCGANTVLKLQKGELDQKKIRTFKTIGFTAVLGIGAIVTFCLAALLFLLIPKARPAEVTAVSWTRTIEMEHYEYNRHENWSLPPGANLVSSSMGVHHYDQELTGTINECSWEQQVSGYEQVCGSEQVCDTYSVYDHTETICYDDGTCDDIDHYRDATECHNETVCRDEPRYQQVQVCVDVPQYRDVPVEQLYYTYDTWEWVAAQTLTLSGTSTDLVWPDLPESDEFREASNGRHEECHVELETSRGKQVRYEPPCSELWRFEPGSEWRVKTMAGSVTDIDPAD